MPNTGMVSAQDDSQEYKIKDGLINAFGLRSVPGSQHEGGLYSQASRNLQNSASQHSIKDMRPLSPNVDQIGEIDNSAEYSQNS